MKKKGLKFPVGINLIFPTRILHFLEIFCEKKRLKFNLKYFYFQHSDLLNVLYKFNIEGIKSQTKGILK